VVAADGFLNWVRDSFGNAPGEDNASQWGTFFSTNIGMFLRNAVIYKIGMILYYQVKGLTFFPENTQQRPITINLPPLQPIQIRLEPIVNDANNLGYAYTPETNDVDNNLPFTQIYGWAQSDGKDWFAISDNRERLVWVADFGIADANLTDKSIERKILNPLYMSPQRNYEPTDLNIIIGGE